MIDEIRKKVAAGRFEYSKHAVDQSILRHITVVEVHDEPDPQAWIDFKTRKD